MAVDFNDVRSYEFNYQQKIVGWAGSYEKAAKKASRIRPPATEILTLAAKCNKCSKDLLPADQVVVLPCFDILHERCSNEGGGSMRVDFLGQTIFFRPHSFKFGIWLYTNRVEISTQVHALIQWAIQNLPSLSLNNLKHLVKITLSSIQDLIDGYEGNSFDVPEIEKRIANLKELRNIKLTPTEIHTITKKFPLEKDFWQEVLAKRRNPGMNEEGLATLSYLIQTVESQTKMTADHLQGHGQLLLYCLNLAPVVTQLPLYSEIARAQDRRFYSHHLQTMQRLSNTQEKSSYISKLDEAALKRLGRLSKAGASPSNILINRRIKRVEQMRMAKYASIALLVIFVLGFILYAAPRKANGPTS